MTAQQHRTLRAIQARHETRDRYAQAQLEAAALRGELGPVAQLTAMSEQYKALKAAGRDDEARALRRAAAAIYATLEGNHE